MQEVEASLASQPQGAQRSLRALLLCIEFPPIGGGGSKVVAGLARELLHQGHEVELVTTAWQRRAPVNVPDGLVLHEIRSPRRRHDRSDPLELLCYVLIALPQVWRLLRRGRYDVCNAHFIFPDGLLAWLAGARRIVLTAHGSDVPGYNPERFRLLHRCLRPLWKRIVNRADILVCASPTLARLAGSAGAVTTMRVIPNGFDVRRSPALLEPGAYLLTVGRLFARKGVRTLIEAHAALGRDIGLHVVGDGPQRAELERLAAAHACDVRFWGWIDGEDERLARFYRDACIFVMPSAAENFPVVLLEAMAAGLAIVTTRNTGCADVVGDAAVLIDAGDTAGLCIALARLLDSPELRADLGRRARARLEREFAWPQVTRAYVEAYRSVAGPGA